LTGDLLVERGFKTQVARTHHELLDALSVRLWRRLLGGVRQFADCQDDRVAFVNFIFQAFSYERLQLVVDTARLYVASSIL